MASSEPVLGQDVAGQATGVDGEQCDDAGHAEAVEEEADEVEFILQSHKIVESPLLWEDRLIEADDLAVGLEGGEEHPHEGEDRCHADRGEDGLQDKGLDLLAHREPPERRWATAKDSAVSAAVTTRSEKAIAEA